MTTPTHCLLNIDSLLVQIPLSIHFLSLTLLLVLICLLLKVYRYVLGVPSLEIGNVAAIRTKYLKFNNHCLEFYYELPNSKDSLTVVSITENQQSDTHFINKTSRNEVRVHNYV